MPRITVQDGKLVVRDGKLGTGQGCCCGGCTGPCDEENPCPPSCKCNRTSTNYIYECIRNNEVDPSITTKEECEECDVQCDYYYCLADNSFVANCEQCDGPCIPPPDPDINLGPPNCTTVGNCGRWRRRAEFDGTCGPCVVGAEGAVTTFAIATMDPADPFGDRLIDCAANHPLVIKWFQENRDRWLAAGWEASELEGFGANGENFPAGLYQGGCVSPEGASAPSFSVRCCGTLVTMGEDTVAYGPHFTPEPQWVPTEGWGVALQTNYTTAPGWYCEPNPLP